jgi:sortase B
VTVGETDKILTLSTCTVKYGSNDYEHRFVVMAKLVPEGTEKKVNADLKEKTSTDQQTEE